MRAGLFTEHGGPEVLRVEEVADVVPGDGECLVRVEACGVEPGLDVMTRRGLGNWQLTLPHVLGPAAVGRIVSAPPGGPQEGTRVAVIPAIPCRACRPCRQGRQNVCGDRRIIGVHRWGGYAELLAAPSENLITLPDTADPVLAAAMPVTYVTAWHQVVVRARVSPADVVLVVGATGNVGFAAAQLALMSGARVLVAGRGGERLEQTATALGEVEVVDLGDDDPVAQVMDLTGGYGADVVVETVGPATWEMSLRAIAPEGRLVTSGGGSGPEVTMNLPAVYRRNITMSLTSQGTHQDARDVFGAFARGRIAPRIAQVFPHEQLVEAHHAIDAPDRPMGKVVLRYPG